MWHSMKAIKPYVCGVKQMNSGIGGSANAGDFSLSLEKESALSMKIFVCLTSRREGPFLLSSFFCEKNVPSRGLYV